MSLFLRKPLLILLLSLAAVGTMSAATVKGIVKDASGDPMIEATVRLLAAKDSSFVKGATTNVSGGFTFGNVNRGKYIMAVSYIGYETAYRDFSIESGTKTLDPVVMKESSVMLKEATVTAVKTEITVKEDTIEYNADSYKTQPNAVMEDLLKKLPGVEVDSEGGITAGGKKVTKILVDGKEFFSDDPKVASQNLPVNMIDKLQVVDRKSDLARLTGVDDGEEETVINLTVKPGMKNGYFGVVNAGYGTDDHYKADFNVNRFWNSNQITFLGNFNNINQKGFTDTNGNRFNRFGGGRGITTTQAFGMNFNVGKSDDTFRVGGDVLYSHTDESSRTSRERQYLFTDSTSFYNSQSGSRDKGHNVQGNFRMKWEIDSFSTLEFRPSFRFNYNKSTSADSSMTYAGDANRSPVTKSFNIGDSDGNSYEVSGDIWFNHKFRSRPGRSFSVSVNYSLSDTREKEDSYSYNRFFLLNDSIDEYDQYTDNHTWNNQLGARLTWTEPIGDVLNGNFFTVSYRANYRWNNADKMVYDRELEELVMNDTLSNRFRNDFFNQRIQVGFKKVNKMYNLDLGIGVMPAMSKSRDLIIEERNIPERWVWNLAPYLRYRYKMGKTRSVNLDYRGNTSQPSIKQLQPVADVSNPLRIVVGNPNLDPSFTHNLRVRFQDFNADAQRSIMAMASARVTRNSIVSKTTFNSETGGQITTYENVNGNWSADVFSMISFPFRNKAWSFNANVYASYNQTIGFNNGTRNRSGALNLRPNFSISFRPDNFDFTIRPTYSWQTTHNTVSKNSNKNVQTYGGMFDASWYAPFGLVLNSTLRFSGTEGYAAGYDEKQWMWNASIAYQFLKGKAATFTIAGYDLLQQRKNISRSVTANYIDDTRYNSLTRYFMATFSYRFNTFGKGNQPSDRNERRGPGGPGGFGGRRR